MFCVIACRWRLSTVSHLSLTAPRHFYYQHTWDEYLCLTPQSRLRVQSIFQGNSGSVQQKIEQKLGWKKKNRRLKFKIFWSVKESEEIYIILVWISTLRRLLCFALHLGKSNFLSLKLEQWSNVLCESKWRRVTPGAKNAGSSLYFWPAGVGEGRRVYEKLNFRPCSHVPCLSFIWTFSPFSKKKKTWGKKRKVPVRTHRFRIVWNMYPDYSGPWCSGQRDPWTLGSRGRRVWEGLRAFSREANPSKSNTGPTCFIRLQDYSLLPSGTGGGGAWPDLPLPLLRTSPRIPFYFPRSVPSFWRIPLPE